MLNEQQRRSREKAIFEAVLSLGEQGQDLTALTVRQIAGAAGIGKGTVYEYFSSKEEILRELTAYCLDSEMDMLESVLTPCTTLTAAEDAALTYLETLVRERIAVYQVVAQAMRRSREPVHQPVVTHVMGRLRSILYASRRFQVLVPGILYALLDRLRAAGQLKANVDNEYDVFAIISACLTCTVSITPCPSLHASMGHVPQALGYTRRLLDAALRGQ